MVNPWRPNRTGAASCGQCGARLAVPVLVLALAGCGPIGGSDVTGTDEAPVLNVYNWSDYIAPETIAEFERRTGIDVNYDVFDSNEVLETKLLAGNTGYDIVVPTASFMERQIKAGVFRPLDKEKLANLGNLDPQIAERAALHDPELAHSIPFLWGTTGIGYNIDLVKAIMPDAPLDSWDMIFDPDVVARFAECGISLLDAPTEVADAVQAYLGLDPNSHDPAELELTEQRLMQIRPYVRYFHSSQYINDLANGQICLVLGWSGDIQQAKTRAAESGRGVRIGYSIPREGTIIWFDMLAIPGDARHAGNAHKFIDYILEPEVIAAISNAIRYANGNAASLPHIEPSVRDDETIYPPAEVRAKLFPDLSEPAPYTRLQTRMWTRVKTGA